MRLLAGRPRAAGPSARAGHPLDLRARAALGLAPSADGIEQVLSAHTDEVDGHATGRGRAARFPLGVWHWSPSLLAPLTAARLISEGSALHPAHPCPPRRGIP